MELRNLHKVASTNFVFRETHLEIFSSVIYILSNTRLLRGNESVDSTFLIIKSSLYKSTRYESL